MSDFSKLGKAIKQLNPAYESQSDEAIGRAEVDRLRNTSALYRNSSVDQLINARIKGLHDEITSERHKENKSTHAQRQIARIEELEDPDSGMVGTFLKRKNLEGKTKRQAQANLYRSQIRDAQYIQHETDMMSDRAERVQAKEAADHEFYLLKVQESAVISMEATESRVDSTTYLTLKAKEGENQLSREQKRELDRLELDKRQEEINQDLKAGFVYQQQVYHHLQLLVEQIGKLHKRVLEEKNGRTKAVLEEHIIFMEGQLRDKQKLLSSADGQEYGGDTTTDSLRDPRQTVEGGEE